VQLISPNTILIAAIYWHGSLYRTYKYIFTGIVPPSQITVGNTSNYQDNTLLHRPTSFYDTDVSSSSQYLDRSQWVCDLSKDGATIGGGGGGHDPHLFQILVFSLCSLVFAQCIDPPTFKFVVRFLNLSGYSLNIIELLFYLVTSWDCWLLFLYLWYLFDRYFDEMAHVVSRHLVVVYTKYCSNIYKLVKYYNWHAGVTLNSFNFSNVLGSNTI